MFRSHNSWSWSIKTRSNFSHQGRGKFLPCRSLLGRKKNMPVCKSRGTCIRPIELNSEEKKMVLMSLFWRPQLFSRNSWSAKIMTPHYPPGHTALLRWQWLNSRLRSKWPLEKRTAASSLENMTMNMILVATGWGLSFACGTFRWLTVQQQVIKQLAARVFRYTVYRRDFKLSIRYFDATIGSFMGIW